MVRMMRMMRRGDCENSHENHRQWDEANDCIGLGLSSARGLKKAGKGCDEHGRSLEGTVQGTLWQQRGGSNRDQHHTQRQGSNYKRGRGRGRGVAIIIISLTQVDAARTTQAANESLGILPSTLQTAIFAWLGRAQGDRATRQTQSQHRGRLTATVLGALIESGLLPLELLASWQCLLSL